MSWTIRSGGPHGGQPVITRGVPLARASSAFLLLHGRGDTAEGILDLADTVPHPGMVAVAPQAASQTWYPNRFLAPIPSNEPWLSSALAAVGDVIDTLVERGIGPERIVLAGFSQGGCLALEFAARYPRRFGGLIGLSAGLIGPPGTAWAVVGSLDGTPVFLGCSDVDGHIPAARVQQSADVLRQLGGDVTAILYPGMDHTVTRDELVHVERIIGRLPQVGG